MAKNEVELDDSERGNLKLMHHYILRGYIDVVGPDPTSEDLPSLWRDYAPKLAFDHKYLLHGLLGISALHLGISDPESQYGDALLASHHYNLAIAEFRTQLTTITTDNIEPLFAFSCILILYCFGTWHIARDRSDPITKLIEILSLIQGTGSIVMSGFDRLKASPFNALLLSSPGVPLPDLPLEIQDVLSKLQSRVSSISDLDLYRDAYSSSLFALQRSFILAMQNPGSNLITVSFAVRITPEFLILATKREPLALAVLANYAALLHTVREHLWFQNWGRQVIHTVEQSLPLEWRDCIDWAVFQAKEG